MKKRILAMLLLVAMVVTALPLVVLPSLAAEQEKEANTFTEADYNALYVLTGMVAGADFYSTNSYWNGTEKTATTAAAAKAILDSYIYPGSTTFNNPVLNAGSFSIKDGYVDLGHLKGEWQFYNVEKLMNYGINGSAVELVRAAKRAAYLPVINSLRISANAAGEVTAINNSSSTMFAGADAITASNKLGTALVYKDFQGVHTYTTNMQRDEILFNAESDTDTFRKKNPGKITDYYTSSTASAPANYYTGENVYPYTIDADGKITVDARTPVYTPEEHGKNTSLTTTKGGALTGIYVITTREYPAKPVIPDFVLDADGNPVANTEKKAYWVAPDNRFVDGAFSVYQDGVKLYENDAAQFINNGFYKGTDSFIVLWGSDAAQIDNSGKFYAARYYNRNLTEAEQAQNHMADILKWFKADISVLASVSADDYVKLAPAFAAFTFESDKEAVEATLVAEVERLVAAKYAGTAAEAYATLAVAYQLDLAPLTANPKGMLVNTYKLLNGGYKTSADVKGDYAKALALDYAAVWENIAMGLEDYNDLYAAQDAALISLDFFKTNEIWGEDMELPTPPNEVTNYVYDGVTYDFTKEEDRLIQYGKHWAVVRSDKVFVYRTKAGAWGTANANYPQANLVTDNFSQNMPRQTFTYEEAKAIKEGVEEYWKSFTFDIVETEIFMIWRTDAKGAKTYYTNAGTWVHDAGKVVDVFKTKADAEAKIAEIKEDGYTYEATVRPVATAAYYQCIMDYCADMSKLMYSVDISDSRVCGITQNMTTIGEVNYHSQTGNNNMYTHVRYENGYMVLDPHHSGPYFSVTNIPNTGTVYLDTVLAGGDTALTGSSLTNGTKLLVFRNANVMLSTNGGSATLVSVAGQAVGATVDGKNTPFRLTIDSVADAAGANATFRTELNGTEVLSAAKTSAIKSQGLIGHSQSSTARIYTYRLYNRTLTDAEQAQNHFADIAKYFKLSLTGYDTLDAEGKAAVHAAVADITFASTRIEAQNAVNAALNVKVDAAYEAMKLAYPAHADFIETAREYRLDIAAVLASTEDMSAVYALSFDGLSCAEAQALLDETYSDTINFYVHQREGEDEWNAWLEAVAKADTVESIDEILVLPFAERVGILDKENNTDAAVIAAFIKEALAKYTITYPEFDSYNSLYVQDGILFGADFFGSNAYWNIDYELPLAPALNTAYWHDANEDGLKTDDEVFDFTDATTQTAAGKAGTPAKAAFDAAKAAWQTAYKTYLNETFKWGGAMNFSVYGSSSVTQEMAPFTLTDGGYAQFHENYATGGGVVFTGIPSKMTASTAQLVMSLSKYSDTGTSSTPLLVHNIRPSVKVHNGEVTFTGLNGASSLGGLYYAQLVVEGSTDKIVYAEYDSRMMPSREKLIASAEEYAAQLTAAAADGATYTAVKINVAKFEIHKNGVKYATMTLENKADPDYILEINPDIKYAYDEVFGMTASTELRDGDDFFSLRTEDGVVGQIEAPYEVSGTRLDYNTHYIGWGIAHKHMKVYAFRQYDRVLSNAEVLQNHFADLAKFYRLDLAGYYMMDADQQAAAHAALNGFDLGTEDRDAIQAALNAEVAKLYEGIVIIGGNEADNAEFIELAALATLDLSAIKMLAPAARAEFAYAMLADFDPDYVVNATVVAYHYAERTATFEAMTFAGYQVRLDTGASLANYAGVRAVFDVDEAAIAAIIEKNDGAAVTLTVKVTGAATQEIVFVYTMEEGVLTCKTDAVIYDRAGGKSVNYTVTYEGDKFTAENLEAEFAYGYSIQVGNAAAVEFAIDTVTFGATVSAAEVYGYFAENGYGNDRMVADVMTLLAE